MSPDGLILTNAHVASPNLPELAAMKGDVALLDSPVPERYVVDLVEAADRAPVPRFVAEVVAADGWLDLAIMRLTTTLDGRAVRRTSLALPHVTLGDSDAVQLGDALQVLGFPGSGGETITLSTGRVSGFVPQQLVGLRAWIKTDTLISPGSSGGLAADALGRLVAVPSQMALMPGELNLLRPAALARPLVRSAREGTAYRSPHLVQGTGRERLELSTWSTAVGADGCATAPVERFERDATLLGAVFRYSGMTDGELLLAEWQLGESRLRSNAWFWNAGERGACYPFVFDDLGRSLEVGRYRIEIRAGERLAVVGRAEASVGSPVAPPGPPGDAVTVVGSVTDAESGQPIAGALIIVFLPGVQAGAWNQTVDRTLDDIYTVAETDAAGRYRIARPLLRGVRYEVAADHPEYLQLLGAFEIGQIEPAEHTVDLALSR